MPISRSEFETGETGPRRSIVNFLGANRGQAFTLTELFHALKGATPSLQLEELVVALNALETEGIVERKRRQGEVYYSYPPLGFRRPTRS